MPRKENRYITVACEFEFLKQYLRLQQLRYGERISYQIELDQSLSDVQIPKLILQPFVENAILHGVEQKEENGKVTVTGKRLEQGMLFTVSDDGAGMDSETLRRLRHGIATPDKSGGYAIRNIQERLSIIYQNSYRLTIESAPNEGTTIALHLPFAMPGKEDINASTANC